jgi:hypothetical protein
MPNMRIVSDNALARAASFTASTTVGTLAASNMLLDVKSAVHRATGTSVTYTATWAATETLACVAIPFCNLSPTATMRVRIYSDTAGTTLVFDSTALPACPASAVVLRGWTALASSMAYAYGGGVYARAWFAAIGCRCLVVDISDASNLAGFVEASRMVAGNYWSPSVNADIGAQLLFDDRSAHVRSDAGDLLTDVGPRMRKLTLNLSYLPASDRTTAAGIFRANGMGTPMLVSVFPGDADTDLERDYTVYGKLSAMSAFTLAAWPAYVLPIEIEEL